MAFRDYIFANRRGLNSLRQLGAPIPVAVPEPSATPPLFPPSAGTLVQGNVYSAAVLVNSRSNTTNKSWAPARVLVELYGQQSQSVALVEAADIAAAQPSAETSAVLSHIEVLLVPDALNLTVSESVQTEAAVLKWVQNGGLLVVAGGALLGGQLSGVAASLDIVVTQLERSARCGTSITLSRNEKAVLATNWFSTATNLNLSTTDSGIVIHDRQAGGGVGSTETIVISKCNGGSSRKFAVARSLHDQLCNLIMQLMIQGGLKGIRLEYRQWDPSPIGKCGTRRVPDVVGWSADGQTEYVVDARISWSVMSDSSTGGAATYEETGDFARQGEKDKWRNWRKAVKRAREQGRDESQVKFVPFSLEIGGGLGACSRALL
eukprot:COSAG01_NODE_8773_length_2664_cov_3.024172_1_plen_377_part_00